MAPVEALARRLIDRGCSANDSSLMLGHRPWVAPLNYALILFPPAPRTWIEAFGKRTKIAIPTFYRAFLTESTNGLTAFDFSLYGLSPSMQADFPMLDRSSRQCLDLSLANQDWAMEFGRDNGFHIGSRNTGDDGQLGYFTHQDGEIIAVDRKLGRAVKSWTGFPAFLAEELAAAETQDGESWGPRH